MNDAYAQNLSQYPYQGVNLGMFPAIPFTIIPRGENVDVFPICQQMWIEERSLF